MLTVYRSARSKSIKELKNYPVVICTNTSGMENRRPKSFNNSKIVSERQEIKSFRNLLHSWAERSSFISFSFFASLKLKMNSGYKGCNIYLKIFGHLTLSDTRFWICFTVPIAFTIWYAVMIKFLHTYVMLPNLLLIYS